MSFNFMDAVIICSDFGAQENKVCHCFRCFPIYLACSRYPKNVYIKQPFLDTDACQGSPLIRSVKSSAITRSWMPGGGSGVSDTQELILLSGSVPPPLAPLEGRSGRGAAAAG